MAAPVSYNENFYAAREPAVVEFARSVLDIVFNDIFRPKSVVDFGCGLGTWLEAARVLGVSDIQGFEGPWVSGLTTKVPNITPVDVGSPIDCGRKFDLAICLEVAEHLPERNAATLISNLCSASDIILFSAAIPNQGGTDHINEQWPSYWISRFAANGFDCFDIVRFRIWRNKEINFWYRQNTIMFARAGSGHGLNATPTFTGQPFDIVHPEMFQFVVRRQLGIRALIGEFPAAIKRRLRR